jgi:hypothetical protein
MDRSEEGKRIRRTVHLPDDVWEAARLGALALCGMRQEYTSTSAFVEEAIREKAAALSGRAER